MDTKTKEIVSYHFGKRTRKSARGLWESLPSTYKQCAVCYTDFWSSYERVIPSKRHQAVDKQSGMTNLIERFNCTRRANASALRQRVSRLVPMILIPTKLDSIQLSYGS